jgi:hypothetical protein
MIFLYSTTTPRQLEVSRPWVLNDFFTGPASRNPDGHTHARVQTDWAPGVTLVSFEDLFNGPFDYNDLSFSFTNTAGNPEPPGSTVPEPSTLLLLVGSGLTGLAAWRRRAVPWWGKPQGRRQTAEPAELRSSKTTNPAAAGSV